MAASSSGGGCGFSPWKLLEFLKLVVVIETSTETVATRRAASWAANYKTNFGCFSSVSGDEAQRSGIGVRKTVGILADGGMGLLYN